jgi:glycosyltransferase involved in cell wall biosynthesis
MRVTYIVHQYLPDHVGGTELYTHGLARRALAHGHDVTVLTYRETSSNRTDDFVTTPRTLDGVPIRELSHNLGVAPIIALAEYDNPTTTEWISEQVRDLQPDVVHVTHAMKFGVGAVEAPRLLGVPVVVTLTDFWFLCPRHTLLTWDGRLCDGPADWRACAMCVRDLHGVDARRAEDQAVQARAHRLRDALARADRVIALSPFMIRMLATNGFVVGGIAVIPHGLEPDTLRHEGGGGDRGRAEPRRSGVTRFVFIGTLVTSKGAHVVIEALRRCGTLDAELVVHGDGPERETLLRHAAGDSRITFAGSFPPEEFGRVVASADYVLAPALWYENEPLVVKAALHLGVPVIVSDLGTLPDMVDGSNGWTVPADDVGAWAHALEAAHAGRATRHRRPTPQPTMDDTYAQVDAVYRAVARTVP